MSRSAVRLMNRTRRAVPRGFRSLTAAARRGTRPGRDELPGAARRRSAGRSGRDGTTALPRRPRRPARRPAALLPTPAAPPVSGGRRSEDVGVLPAAVDVLSNPPDSWRLGLAPGHQRAEQCVDAPEHAAMPFPPPVGLGPSRFRFASTANDRICAPFTRRNCAAHGDAADPRG